MTLKLGTRGSKLALRQADIVTKKLQARYPNLEIELVTISTKGDQNQNLSLTQLGGNGVFMREIESALVDGKIDFAVHSRKDLPAHLDERCMLCDTWEREDPRDVLVSREGKCLADLPYGASIASCSPRRNLQILAMRPDLHIVPIRGNVDSRIRKLYDTPYDGLILAAAGLKRLGMEYCITEYFPLETFIPSPCQGFLAIEILKEREDLAELFAPLAEQTSNLCANTERCFLQEMHATCQNPIGAYAYMERGIITLTALFSAKGKALTYTHSGTNPEEIAREVAKYFYQELSGKVYLVGAGCGDRDLLTLKAKRAIQKADCILYDSLIDTNILSLARADCELIFVGKEYKKHSHSQEEIHTLLLQKSLQYKHIVRLKGGDPFVFGRGGEECLILAEKGISFEVISGISSVIGGLASAGIPVTHRGMADGFTVVTAHPMSEEKSLDFLSLVALHHTLIFVMGLHQVKRIVEGLFGANMPSHTPIALVSCACRNRQKTLVSTLERVLDELPKAKLKSPTLICVGDVVTLAEHINFHDTKPLYGRKFLYPKITPSDPYIEECLREHGAIVDTFTVGEIAYLPFSLEQIEQAEWLILTSKHAVKALMHTLLESELDTRFLAHTKLAVIGEKTANALQSFGLRADFIGKCTTSSAMIRDILPYIQNKKVVYLSEQTAEKPWESDLQKLCSYQKIAVYFNGEVPIKHLDISAYDSVIFTASSSVKRMYTRFGDVLHSLLCYCIGPSTARTLQILGFTRILRCETASYEALVQRILD